MRIRPKLGLILIVPVIALVGLAILRIFDSTQEAFEAGDVADVVEFNSVASDLLYDLQQERAAAALVLAGDNVTGLEDGAQELSVYTDTFGPTDGTRTEYEALSGQLPDSASRMDALIARIEENMGGVLAVRTEIAEGESTPNAEDVHQSYNAVINDLSQIFEFSQQIIGDPEISRNLRVAELLTDVVEYSEQERLMALASGHNSTFNTTGYQEFVRLTSARQQALTEFTVVADSVQYQRVFGTDGPIGSGDSRAAVTFETTRVDGGVDSPLIVDGALMAAFDHRTVNSQDLITDQEELVVSEARESRDAVVQQTLIESAVVLIILVLAVITALVIARSLAGSLRTLREGALEVAHVTLPQAVARMRDADTMERRTPEQIAEDLPDPLRIDNRDEVGTVARSFNIVHREAVRVAAEQAVLRASVSQMFINLARRSQNLVDRLIGHLDRLERGEENPDRLAELFQLDHLATRMRRNDENLLVLAGADSTRVEREPAPINDVLQAAQSEVEQYTRIEFGTVLADSEIVPGAVNDLVHLLAELLDNATTFSSPDTTVIAEARQIGDEITVRITDRGIGLSPTQLGELNAQLSAPPTVDITASRMMGLVVVGRLANRHNLKVRLHLGEGRGTVAEVVLPGSVLTVPERTGRHGESITGSVPQQALPPAAEPPPAPDSPPRSLFEPFAPSSAEHVEPFSAEPVAAEQVADERDNSGLSFRPGGDDSGLPRRKVMELTGEIVSSESAPLPQITLEAAPLPGPAPAAPSGNGKHPHADTPPQWPAGADSTPTAAPVSPAAARMSAADETMELPIFREVESAWFMTATPAPRPVDADDGPAEFRLDSEPAPAPMGEPAAPLAIADRTVPEAEAEPEQVPAPAGISANGGTVAGTGESGAAQRRMPPPPATPDAPEFSPLPSRTGDREGAAMTSTGSSGPWHTAADTGWQQAATVNSVKPDESTSSGLPKRRPMERLVPGGVEEPAPQPVQRRNPEGVRGLLSAYHRGVQRGRGTPSVDSAPDPASSDSDGAAGKERNG